MTFGFQSCCSWFPLIWMLVHLQAGNRYRKVLPEKSLAGKLARISWPLHRLEEWSTGLDEHIRRIYLELTFGLYLCKANSRTWKAMKNESGTKFQEKEDGRKIWPSRTAEKETSIPFDMRLGRLFAGNKIFPTDKTFYSLLCHLHFVVHSTKAIV